MKQRPVGITILSILLLIGGILMLSMQILSGTILGRVMNNFTVADFILLISISFLGLLSLLSGIGMFLGKKWGWWLGAFYFVYAVLRNVNALIAVFTMLDMVESSSRGLSYYLTLYPGRIIINGLLVRYFFKDNVMEYFKIGHYSKGKSALKLFGVGFGIFIVLTIVTTIF